MDGRKGGRGGWPRRALLSERAAELIRRALPVIDGWGAAPETAGAEALLQRTERVRRVLMPGLGEADYARACSRRGETAPLAVLATALKALTRSAQPIRDPTAYWRGTVWKPPGHSDPAASLEAVLATHAALGAAGSDPSGGAPPPRPPASAGAPPGAGGGTVLP